MILKQKTRNGDLTKPHKRHFYLNVAVAGNTQETTVRIQPNTLLTK